MWAYKWGCQMDVRRFLEDPSEHSSGAVAHRCDRKLEREKR